MGELGIVLADQGSELLEVGGALGRIEGSPGGECGLGGCYGGVGVFFRGFGDWRGLLALKRAPGPSPWCEFCGRLTVVGLFSRGGVVQREGFAVGRWDELPFGSAAGKKKPRRS